MFMKSSGANHQQKLNQLNTDIRKTLAFIDNLTAARRRDLERVETRYDNDIQRHQQTIKRLTREIEQLERELARNQK